MRYFDSRVDRPGERGGPSGTASTWPRLYHFDVDGQTYWLTNTNPDLTLRGPRTGKLMPGGKLETMSDGPSGRYVHSIQSVVGR